MFKTIIYALVGRIGHYTNVEIIIKQRTVLSESAFLIRRWTIRYFPQNFWIIFVNRIVLERCNLCSYCDQNCDEDVIRVMNATQTYYNYIRAYSNVMIVFEIVIMKRLHKLRRRKPLAFDCEQMYNIIEYITINR